MIVAFSSISILAVSCTFKKMQPLPAECNSTVFYSTEIKPIIESKCVSCHVSGGSGTGDFTFFSELKSAIDNGTFRNNVFVLKTMPPAGTTQLTEDELSRLNCWILQGKMNN